MWQGTLLNIVYSTAIHYIVLLAGVAKECVMQASGMVWGGLKKRVGFEKVLRFRVPAPLHNNFSACET